MITKFQLMMALFTGGPLVDRLRGLELTVVCSVEREDGSGQSFNVTGYGPDGTTKITRCVRTID